MLKKIKGVYDDALNLRKCSLCDNDFSAPYSVIGQVFASVSGPLHPGTPVYSSCYQDITLSYAKISSTMLS